MIRPFLLGKNAPSSIITHHSVQDLEVARFKRRDMMPLIQIDDRLSSPNSKDISSKEESAILKI